MPRPIPASEPKRPANPADPSANPVLLARAEAALVAGEPVIIPTDTVYGLAVRAGDAEALERVFELKRRPRDASVAILVASTAQAEQLVELNRHERRVADAFWPGALTIVARRLVAVSPSIGRDDGTVGVRAPAEPWVLALCERVGPLATTSANRSGEPTPAQAQAAAAALDGTVAVVVDAGPRTGSASTVARIQDRAGEPVITILRPGPVTEQMLIDAIG